MVVLPSVRRRTTCARVAGSMRLRTMTVVVGARLRRYRTVLPEEAGMGHVPAREASGLETDPSRVGPKRPGR